MVPSDAMSRSFGHPMRLPGFAAQDTDGPVAAHRKETLIRVGDDKVSVAVELKTEGTALRVGEALRPAPIRLKAHDAPVLQAGVDAPLRIYGDAFGRVPARREALRRRQARVRLVNALERRRGGRLPRRRINRHGPKQQIQHGQRRER